MTPSTRIEEKIAGSLRAAGCEGAEFAIVLGSGLGAVCERLEGARSLPFSEVEAMPGSTVPGHAGRFLLGHLAGRRILVQEGRVHLYEGRHPREVTASVRAFAELGIENLLLTNAAGCLEPEWPVPSLMRIDDHQNLQGRAPLRRGEQGRGSPYDPSLGAALDAAAKDAGVTLRHGVYAAMLGPAYETPAEIRMLAGLGAQAVGMSTVAEASAGWALGLRVGALSCLSNHAAGIHPGGLRHAEVVAAGDQVAEELAELFEALLRRFDS